MALKKVTAIFDSLKLEAVEDALLRHGVRGFTVQKVRGRGAYFDSYNRDPLTPHSLLMLYTSEANVAAVTQAIFDAAGLGFDHGGLVGVEPVEAMYWINDGKCCEDSDFETGQRHGK